MAKFNKSIDIQHLSIEKCYTHLLFFKFFILHTDACAHTHTHTRTHTHTHTGAARAVMGPNFDDKRKLKVT